MSNTSEAHKNLGKILLAEQRQRDDLSNYVGALLVRQRVVNHLVLQFAGDLIPPGGTIVDACAGPEGSFVASRLSNHGWVGNDLSHRFARNLKRTGADLVCISDFCDSPLKDGVADAVLFVFALNNVNNPEKALAEAVRVTKPDGSVIIADPGPSMWVSKILAQSVLGQMDHVLKGEVYESIPDYFETRPYSQENYANFELAYRLGMTREELQQYAQSTLRSNRNEIPLSQRERSSFGYGFHVQVVEGYYRNIERLVGNLGLEHAKTGIGLAAQNKHEEWIVCDPIPTLPESWVDDVMSVRQRQNGLTHQFPIEALKKQRRLFFSILCLTKSG